MKSDLHISQEKKLKNISDIAKKIGLRNQIYFYMVNTLQK